MIAPVSYLSHVPYLFAPPARSSSHAAGGACCTTSSIRGFSFCSVISRATASIGAASFAATGFDDASTLGDAAVGAASGVTSRKLRRNRFAASSGDPFGPIVIITKSRLTVRTSRLVAQPELLLRAQKGG